MIISVIYLTTEGYFTILACIVSIIGFPVFWWFLFIRPGVYFKTDGSIIIKTKPAINIATKMQHWGTLVHYATATQVVRIGADMRITGLDIEIDYDNGNSDYFDNPAFILFAVLEWISYPGFSKRLDKLDTKICEYRIKLKENNQL